MYNTFNEKYTIGEIKSLPLVSGIYTTFMAGGLSKFDIVLDSWGSRFSPGEMVAGRVIVELGRTKTMRGLKLRFTGKGEVKWSESPGTGSDSIAWYTANEEYFWMEVHVLGNGGFNESVEINSGSHIFPFNFVLPHNIPSSFEHEHGHVRYIIEAVMDRPWKFDHKTSVLVTIEAPNDLSHNPAAKIAIEDREHDTFGCFSCFNMGSLSLNINIPASGFAIGEAIEAKIALNNTSTSVDVTNIKLYLKQTITLRATEQTKTEINFVQNVGKGGPFDKNDEVIIGMQVPALPPSNFPHCKIIDIDYRLVVQVAVSGCHCNIDRSYPIIIGTRTDLKPQSMHSTYVLPVPMQTPTLLPMQQPASNAPFFGAEDGTHGTVPCMPFSEKPWNENIVPTAPSDPPYGFPMADCEQMPSSLSGPVFQFPLDSRLDYGFGCPIPEQTTDSPTEIPPPPYDICTNTKI